GGVVSERVKQDVLRWVQEQGQGRPRAAPEGTEETEALEGSEEPEEEEGELSYPLELLYCLYETQESAFVHQALRGWPELQLERVRFSRMDLVVLSYCVRSCPAGQALRLVSCALVPPQEKKKKKSLIKRLHGSLGGSSSQATMRKPQASPLRALFEAMIDQHCGLHSLTLCRCRLPDSVCQDLS
ncbi:unnamed protein product, partial [Gulo gulo]